MGQPFFPATGRFERENVVQRSEFRCGGGLTGLVIEPTTTSDEAQGGGDKVVQKALDIPPGYQIIGVRVGCENSKVRSYITQVRLAEVQNPPGTALVLLDDPTHLNAAAPTYANSAATSVDPANGPLLLDLRVNFGNTADRIVVRGLGLLLSKQ
ncbi:MAG: hypothetical protein ABSD59_07825 [Terracidiphilus sp.]